MQPTSKKPRKQRKWQATAPQHKKRKMTSSHLSQELIGKYRRRSVPVRKGDHVTLSRGDFKGLGGEVLRVDVKTGRVYVEGLTMKKADGTDVGRPVHASDITITELYIEDKERRKLLEKKIAK